MSRPGTSHGDGPSSSSDLSKHNLKTKPSIKTFDLSDEDQTNYELLAKSSPHKAPPAAKKTINSFLSDDDDPVPISKPSLTAAAKAPTKRGPKPKQPLVAKKVAAPQSKPKPVALSPAAKAYAAKQSQAQAAKNALSEDEDEEMEDVDAPPAKPAARGRPARAAVAKAKDKKPIYIESDDDDDRYAAVEDDESEEDDFDEDTD
jgi:DNA topoisomerase-2